MEIVAAQPLQEPAAQPLQEPQIPQNTAEA